VKGENGLPHNTRPARLARFTFHAFTHQPTDIMSTRIKWGVLGAGGIALIFTLACSIASPAAARAVKPPISSPYYQ
jgi:hypothetical protein